MIFNSRELQPTKDKLVETFCNNTIDRNLGLVRFVSLINSLETCTSLAIDGKWGDGKTFFVKQAKLVIDSCNPVVDDETSVDEKEKISDILQKNGLSKESIRPQVTVYYDAWINDNDVDPLLSLVYEIARSTKSDFGRISNSSFLDKATSVIEVIPEVNIKDAVKSLYGDNPLEDIERQKIIELRITDFLDSILPERGERLNIIIDELDRCKPTFAVNLLEKIKHFFANHKVTFIFAINTKELQHTIKKYYGDEFDANRYLDRFFDLRLTLPPANMDNYYKSIGIDDSRDVFSYIYHTVAEKFGNGMRDKEKIIRFLQIATYSLHHQKTAGGFEEELGLRFGHTVLTPICIGLHVSNIDQYNNFINGSYPDPLTSFFTDTKNAEWICRNILNQSETFGKPSKNQTKVKVEDKLKDVYNAIFNNQDSKIGTSGTIIGRCAFNNNTKESIINVSSLLSEYAMYDEGE